MNPRELRAGDVVRILDLPTETHGYQGCLMYVVVPKTWGATLCCLVPQPGVPARVPYRANWDQMEFVGHVGVPGAAVHGAECCPLPADPGAES